jgi:microcystin degradation protein MlrC
LRQAVGGRGVDVRLVGDLGPDLLDVIQAIAGITGAESRDGHLSVTADEPMRVTPDLIRALVAGGVDILEVRERASTLEQAYFEVMGVEPRAGEAV